MYAWTLPTTGNKLNKSWTIWIHIVQVFRWILKIVFSQVPEMFFAHSVAQFGSDIPTIRQVTHRKPPFYSSSTKRFSCNGLITDPITKALHEQETVIESRESRIDIVLGTGKGRRRRNNWCNARASSWWESPILDYNEWRNSWEASKL